MDDMRELVREEELTTQMALQALADAIMQLHTRVCELEKQGPTTEQVELGCGRRGDDDSGVDLLVAELQCRQPPPA